MPSVTTCGSAGGRCVRRQTRRRTDKASTATPAHLCQLYSFRRSGENASSVMYQPTANMPKIVRPSTQCRTMASGV